MCPARRGWLRPDEAAAAITVNAGKFNELIGLFAAFTDLWELFHALGLEADQQLSPGEFRNSLTMLGCARALPTRGAPHRRRNNS